MFKANRKSISKLTLAGIGVSFVIATSMSARATPTETETFNAGASLQSLMATGDFTLPDFNTQLGTLDSIDITLTVNSSSTIEVYNSTNSAVDFTNASLTVPGSVTGPGGASVSAILNAVLTSGVAQPGMNTYEPTPTTITKSETLSDPGILSQWEDQVGGVVNLTYNKGSATYQGTDTGDGNLLFGGAAKGCGEFSVEYTYSNDSAAVAEPASKYLTAIAAAAGVFLLMRRRKFAAPVATA